jgi:hypothetical protein
MEEKGFLIYNTWRRAFEFIALRGRKGGTKKGM